MDDSTQPNRTRVSSAPRKSAMTGATLQRRYA